MLKRTQGITLITLSFGILSPQVMQFIEREDHGITLIDGTSATEDLKEILEDLSDRHNSNFGISQMVEHTISRIKNVMPEASSDHKARLQKHIDQGRSKQEKARKENELIEEVLKSVDNLLTWALKFDEPEVVKPVVELKVPAPAAEPKEAKISTSQYIQNLLEEMDNPGCCGICRDGQDDQLEELANATSGDNQRIQDFLGMLMGGAGGQLPEAFVRGMKEAVADREAGTLKTPVEKLQELKRKYGFDMAETAGESDTIKSVKQQLADQMGIDPTCIQIIAVPTK